MQDERAADAPSDDASKAVDDTPKAVAEVVEPTNQQGKQTMAAKEAMPPPNPAMPASPTELFERSTRWMDMASSNMASMLEAVQGTMTHFRACQEVTLAFMRDRMLKSQEFTRTLLAQDRPDGLVHASAVYQRTMVEDYVRYGQRLGDMTLATVSEHMGPLEKRAQETLGKFSKAA